MRLGIMGGTFDPIHYGHLLIAEEARVHFRLNTVQFIPNGSPPHKPDRTITSATHRYAMTLIATRPNPGFGCSPIELNRPGPSYTIDTLDIVHKEYPTAEIFTITGVDAIAEILTWNRHEDVIQRTTFIAATRPGFDLQILKDRLPHAYLEKILLVGSTALDISSTDLRERVRQGLSIRYLTPDGVVDYIAKHGLYVAAEPAVTTAPL
jgi:nicotinate-nucleotide adenylyltransferase